MEDSKRLAWIDWLKAFLISLVVLGHAIQWVLLDNEAFLHNGLWNRIYCFHMPAFIFISGFLAGKVKPVDSLFGYLKRCLVRLSCILVPYYVWGALCYHRLILCGEGHWYLWTLAIFLCLWYLCQMIESLIRIGKRYLFVAMGCIVLICHMCFGMSFFQARISLLPFFVCGIVCRGRLDDYDRALRNPWVVGLAAMTAIVGLYGYENRTLVTFGAASATGISVFVYRFIVAASVIVLLSALALRCQNLRGSGIISSFVTFISTYTLGIYTSHYLALDFLAPYVRGLNGWGVCMLWALAYVFSLSIVYFASRQPMIAFVLLGRLAGKRNERFTLNNKFQ